MIRIALTVSTVCDRCGTALTLVTGPGLDAVEPGDLALAVKRAADVLNRTLTMPAHFEHTCQQVNGGYPCGTRVVAGG